MAGVTPTKVASLARSHTESCIRTLAHIMAKPEATDQSKIAAAEALLSRGWGRPPQSIEVEDKTIRLEGPERVIELGRRITYLLALAGVSIEGDSPDAAPIYKPGALTKFDGQPIVVDNQPMKSED